jgi:2,3-dihydroxybiphenyl 1,2-dioxygenase
MNHPPLEVSALGYLAVGTDRLEDWSDYATRLLGLQLVDRSHAQTSFRMDDRKQRLVVSREADEAIAFIGWEVPGPDALERVARRLETSGVAVHAASRDLCDQRFVGQMIWCRDPEGNRLEFFCDPEVADDPFRPGRSISGFRTGAHGMGHVVMKTPNVEALLPFYRDVLGFRVSDYALTPIPLYFFHVNERHHSFAMVGSASRGLHHLMVEYGALDDVGQGYDLALLEEGRISQTLGRHTNDYMTSFYTHTPSGFFIESGHGGRLIDPETWTPHETDCGPSFWGHERLYLSDEQRDAFRDMRLALARNGQRAPDCRWLEALRGSPRG